MKMKVKIVAAILLTGGTLFAQPMRGVMSPVEPTERDFRDLKSWGATLMRYQMQAAKDSDGTTAAERIAAFDRAIAPRLDALEKNLIPWGRKYGIKLVVDLHTPPGGRENCDLRMFHDARLAAHFVDFWRKTAQRFKGHADVIYGYDLVNEPDQKREAKLADYWEVQRRAAEAVRAIDPDTTILIATNGWNKPDNFSYLPPLAMDNVIYQVHVYQPMAFTHQGVLPKYRNEVTRWPDETKGWNKEWLRKLLEPVREFQQRHHAKIYVGEFSAVAWAEGADAYLRDCISLFEEYGWDWSYHAFREWPGWSVEHACAAPDKPFVPASDTSRKRALLDGFRR